MRTHTTTEGIFRDGRIELRKVPQDIADGTRVILTFLLPGRIDLREQGIDEYQAANLRARLGSIAKDWDSPEMCLYDVYDAAKDELTAR